ncbi:MAG: hypothetical protein M1817_005163 [Caeruleum heppii]|nr:MAG: hypothetical protein M1817_005163 [Caeruleum heppii]
MSKPLIKACFVLPGPAESRSGNNDGLQSSHAPVDIGLADAAITELRRSSSRSVLYEQLWFRSGAATALDWVLSRNVATEGAAHPAVKDLVRSLLEDTTVRLEKVEASRHRAHVSMSVSNERRQDLQRSLASWAERAHTELRMRLDLAFESERWRRISWWKLPFRVDDVEMIASGVLERYWLNEAEKEIIWMVGRMEEAGFFMDPDPKFPSTSDTGRSSFDALIASRRLGSAPPAPRMIDVAPERRESTTRFDRSEAGSWPFRILAVRMALRDGTVPNLQALAQSLLLQSLSSAAATTAFTALIYISYSGTTLYEAGAVAALGLSWTLRHLQKKWEAARSSWASEVQEVARKALKDTEDGLAGTLAKEGQVRESAEEHEQRFRAKVLLARASQELNNLS